MRSDDRHGAWTATERRTETPAAGPHLLTTSASRQNVGLALPVPALAAAGGRIMLATASTTARVQAGDGEVLGRVSSPAALRALQAAQLPALAEEIRAFLVSSVARAGGHLGPNLGVVELTVALHRVFDSPRDTVLFDTGHQAYVHKLLTGRRDGFASLRRAGGLSGYPCRAE